MNLFTLTVLKWQVISTFSSLSLILCGRRRYLVYGKEKYIPSICTISTLLILVFEIRAIFDEKVATIDFQISVLSYSECCSIKRYIWLVSMTAGSTSKVARYQVCETICKRVHLVDSTKTCINLVLEILAESFLVGGSDILRRLADLPRTWSTRKYKGGVKPGSSRETVLPFINWV